MSDAPPPSPFPAGSVPVAFLCLAILLWLDPWGAVEAPRPYQARPPEVSDPSPLRDPPTEKMTIQRAGIEYRCVECHRHFQNAEPIRDRTMGEHRDIELDHGANDRCLNCHHRENRNALVDHGGEEIPFSDVPRLCGKCHGTIYRDWKRGIHGKRVGSWQLDSADRRAFACNECHDPHAPRFPSLTPAPPPRGPDVGRGRPTTPTPEEAPRE